MSRLKTPTQYESVLDSLNEVRPFHLTDEVQRHLACLVGINEPVAKDQPVSGLLLKADNQGSILSSPNDAYENVEVVAFDVFRFATFVDITFSQQVYGVIWNPISESNVRNPFWCDSGYSIIYNQVSKTTAHYLPFVGTLFRVAWEREGDVTFTGNCYGFY